MTHAKGMRLSGHVPNGMTAEQFVRAGADEIQHMNFIFLNFMADKAGDTRTPARLTVVGENAAALDQNSPAVAAFLRLLLDEEILRANSLLDDVRHGEDRAERLYRAAEAILRVHWRPRIFAQQFKQSARRRT